MGKIIDAEFGGRNAGDRYCVSCNERFPRRAALCPCCGGALTLWAIHSASKKKHDKSLGKTLVTLATFVALLVAAIVLWIRAG